MTATPLPFPLPAWLATACGRLEAALPAVLAQAAAGLARQAERSPPGYRHRRLTDAQALVQTQAAGSSAPFSRTVRDDAAAACGACGTAQAAPAPTDWRALTLVDDTEVDRQVAADRLGMAMSLRCEWEWRALEGTLRTLLPTGPAGQRALPLSPAAVGHAMLAALSAWPIDADLRRSIETAVAEAWADALPALYATLGQDLATIAPACAAGATASNRSPGTEPAGHALPIGSAQPSPAPLRDPQTTSPSQPRRAVAADAGSVVPTTRSTDAHASATATAAEEDFTRLLRRWTLSAASDLGVVEGSAETPPDIGPGRPDAKSAPSRSTGRPWPNLIRAHGDHLRAHARHALDHRVIDAVGELFEQILSDPKVPAPMGQQIARLQLPVLRAALEDPGFFGRSDHPVRRALDRLAALGAGLDALRPDAAQALLARVREAVQVIVDGDFARLSVFSEMLDALEHFVAEQGRDDLRRHGADVELLAEQERLERRTLRLGTGLAAPWSGLGMPDFLLGFIVGPWCRVVVCHATRHGLDSPATRQVLVTARELALSIVPRADRERQRAFVAGLPRLMQQLTAGMDLIDWPAAERHAFFDQLLPCHARTLRGEGRSTLDLNLLAARLDLELHHALAQAWPDEPAPENGPAAWTGDAQPRLPAKAAHALGLLDDAQVEPPATSDTPSPHEPTEPAVTAEPAVTTDDLALPGLPAADAVEPMSGEALADRLAVGYAYQMQLPDGWHAVRLTHISPGGLFVVFVRGHRHQRLISLTQRMVRRLCREGRLRRVESATLVERATARARAQLADLRRGAALSPA